MNYVSLVIRFLSLDLQEQFSPIRGLRLRDPFSLYLFHTCMEGLSASLKRMKINGKIEKIKVQRNNPTI